MDRITKFKEWMNENIPMLTVIYENKYVGMVSDRFASLPPKQQKQTILGVFATLIALIIGYIGASYLSLWSIKGNISESQNMISLLQKHQKDQRNQSSNISTLERNSQLSRPGQFKKFLIQQGQLAQISPRMIKVEEKPDVQPPSGDSKKDDINIKQATVTLEKVNLTQLKAFLSIIEFGNHNLGVSSIKIKNDEKIRGYMNVEFGIVAYLFRTERG